MRLKGILKRVQHSYLKQLYPGHIQVIIPSNGRKLLVSESISWAYSNGDYYEKNVIYQLDKILKMFNQPVMIDAGANCGYYTLRYADICKKIYSFEPVATTYQTLKRNITRNKLNNITPFKAGLSDVNNQVTINLYNSSGNNSIFERDLDEEHPLKKTGAETIELYTLDKLVENGVVEMPDIIKIDIEGAELNMLIGGRRTINHKRPVMLVEYADSTANDAGYKKEELLTTLNLADYKIYGIPEAENDLTLIKEADLARFNIGNVIFMPLEVNHLFNAGR